MKNLLRRWLGIQTDEAMVQRLSDSIERQNVILAGNLNMIGEQLANLALRLEPDEVPEIIDGVTCQNGHGDLWVVTVLEEIDRKTGAKRTTGYGLHCPRCEANFYYTFGGKERERFGTKATVEIDTEPAEQQRTTVARPEPERPKLRFRR